MVGGAAGAFSNSALSGAGGHVTPTSGMFPSVVGGSGGPFGQNATPPSQQQSNQSSASVAPLSPSANGAGSGNPGRPGAGSGVMGGASGPNGGGGAGGGAGLASNGPNSSQQQLSSTSNALTGGGRISTLFGGAGGQQRGGGGGGGAGSGSVAFPDRRILSSVGGTSMVSGDEANLINLTNNTPTLQTSPKSTSHATLCGHCLGSDPFFLKVFFMAITHSLVTYSH